MAITAVRHLLGQSQDALRIFVSDNSSDEKEVTRLADFCASSSATSVTYMRAPGNFPQGRHWDWATREALRRSGATHVTVHYDRKILRPGQGGAWLAVAERFPDKVFTYATDTISAEPPPLRLWQAPHSGGLYRVKTARTVELCARGEALEMGHTLPVLSNCIVPRAVVESIVERFGTLCESTTADSCFAFRFCALHEDYLHLDRSLSVLYGSHRSAGLGYLRDGGGDFADYRRTWGEKSWLDAAPVPGLNLGYNMLFHEYELVRREVPDRLPPLDREGCLRDLARGLVWIADQGKREEIATLLRAHGWTGDLPAMRILEGRGPAWRRVARKVRQRAVLFLAEHFDAGPKQICGFQFPSDDEAVRFALKYPRPPEAGIEHLHLVRPVEEKNFNA